MNEFKKAKEFKAIKTLLLAIEELKKNGDNNANIEIIKQLMTEKIVGIIPVSVCDPKGKASKDRIFSEEEYEWACKNKISGWSQKIETLQTESGEYQVMFTDYSALESSGNARMKDYSYIPVTGFEILYLATLDDTCGLIINPYTCGSVVLRSFFYRGFTSLPVFDYEGY